MNKYFNYLIYHGFIIGPLLIYIGGKKEKANKKIKDLFILLALLAIIYHIEIIYRKRLTNSAINFIHIFIMAPLLLYIGIKEDKTDEEYNIIMIIGLVITFYFLYNLIEFIRS